MATNTNEPQEEQQPARESRNWLWSLLAGLLMLGLIATVPVFNDPAALHTSTLILMYIILAQGWNFIGGFAGYSAFGNTVFFGIGAYTTGLLLNAGQPFWLGLLVGILVAAIFAFLVGLPILRLRGHYFAIATLGTAEAVRELVTVRNVGGAGGLMQLPLLGPEADTLFFYGFLVLCLVCLLITAWLTRSSFGYALISIRENEQAAEALGIATHRYKVAAFVLSAIPTAIAGGMYGYWANGFDPPTVFNVGIAVEMVLLSFLGGTGTILGPIIGGIAFELFSFQMQTSGFSLHDLLLGLAIAIVTIFLPQGAVRLFGEFFRRPALGARRTNSFIEGMRRVRRYIAANGI